MPIGLRRLPWLLLLAPLAAAAQSVRGTVVDRGGAPVAGVVVRLVTQDSTQIARALTNARGEFALGAPSAGTFRLSTLRIGFRPVTSEPFVLTSGEALERRVELTGIPFSLGQVVVAGRNSCGRAIRSQRETFELLEQVRAAITATELTAGMGEVVTSGVAYRRAFDAAMYRVLEQQAVLVRGAGGQPWAPVPIDALRREGYVVDAGDSLSYRAPGLATLASDEFVVDHCFRIAQGPDTSMIGVAFEPVRDRGRVSEVQGTIWIDRASSELRRIEYRYVNVHRLIADAGAGGEVQFVRTNAGAWVVSRWSIRMPELQMGQGVGRVESTFRTGTIARPGASALIVAAIHTTGGDLSSVVRASATTDTLWRREPLSLTGSVVDSISGSPIPGAQVSVREMQRFGVTTADGGFALRGLLPGNYTIEVRTPSLDSANASVIQPYALIDSGPAVRLRVPSAVQLATAICGAEPRDNILPGIVMGTVRRVGADSVPIPNASVIAEWVDVISQEMRSRDATSDVRGNFRFCGIPVGRTVVVRAGTDRGGSEPVVAAVPANRRLARADLYVDPAISATATFTGVVVSDTANPRALTDVEVSIPALQMSVRTNARGEFRLRDIPPGEHRVIARRPGFGPLEVTLAVVANRTIQRRIVLSPVTVLNEVSIVAERMRDPGLRLFEENRKLGLGKFLTRQDLDQRPLAHLSDVLRPIPGLRLSVQGGKAWVSSSRGCGIRQRPSELEGVTPSSALVTDGCCYPTVYLDRVRLTARGGGTLADVVPNINNFSPDQLEAIEFYPSVATVPTEYHDIDMRCGVLVLHTRR